jgi:hypothetical protein
VTNQLLHPGRCSNRSAVVTGWDEDDLWDTHYARSVSPSPLPQVRLGAGLSYHCNSVFNNHAFIFFPFGCRIFINLTT